MGSISITCLTEGTSPNSVCVDSNFELVDYVAEFKCLIKMEPVFWLELIHDDIRPVSSEIELKIESTEISLLVENILFKMDKRVKNHVTLSGCDPRFPKNGDSLTLQYHPNNTYTLNESTNSLPTLNLTCNDNRIHWMDEDHGVEQLLTHILDTVFEHSLPFHTNYVFNQHLLWRMIGYKRDKSIISFKLPKSMTPVPNLCDYQSQVRQVVESPTFPIYAIIRNMVSS